jgi:hypothetical protein
MFNAPIVRRAPERLDQVKKIYLAVKACQEQAAALLEASVTKKRFLKY